MNQTAHKTPTIRCFYAILFDSDALHAIDSMGQTIRRRCRDAKIRWIKRDNVHLTLRFIGEIQPNQADRLNHQLMQAIALVAPFDISLFAPQLFPSPHNPRLISLQVSADKPLFTLAHIIEDTLVACGLPPQKRPFRAHISIARFKFVKHKRVILPTLSTIINTHVASIHLVQSKSTPQGVIYIPLATLPLRGVS